MASGLAWLGFRCTGCGDCCRQLRVPLTRADLARLLAATGARAETLVDWARATEVDLSGEPSSLVLLPEGPRVMLLSRRAGACSLLGADGSCSAHAARPAACRLYPFDVSLGKRSGVRRLRLLDDTCREYALDGSLSPADLRRDATALRLELAEHHAAIEAFNRTQRHRRRFGRPLATAAEFLERLLASTRAFLRPDFPGRRAFPSGHLRSVT